MFTAEEIKNILNLCALLHIFEITWFICADIDNFVKNKKKKVKKEHD